MDEQIPARPFNGLWAIQAHFELRAKIEAFVHGKSQEHFGEPMTCTSSCMLAKWIHGKDGLLCKDRQLLDSICQNCEGFLEHASQAVIMKKIGDDEAAKQALSVGGKYSEASLALQSSLVSLHLISS